MTACHDDGTHLRRIINTMPKPTLVSLFTGAGGLDLGLEQAGFETLFANEVEPYACESLRANRVLQSLVPAEFDLWFNTQVTKQRCYRQVPLAESARLRRRLAGAVNNEAYLAHAHIVERDIRTLLASEILEAIKRKPGEIDLVAGGPPCQPFSRAGKRELVECDTGQLFRDFVRIVTALRPRWFLFENVKGLVLHKADVASQRCPSCKSVAIVEFALRESIKESEEVVANCRCCGYHGRQAIFWDKRRAGSLEIIQGEFERAGYTCSSIILNAADYGAPQHRERLFIVGSRDGEKLTWPTPTYGGPDAKRRSLPTLFDRLKTGRFEWQTVNDALYNNGHWGYGQLDPAKAVLWVKNVVRPHDEPVTWTLDRPAPTIGAHQSAKLAIAPLGVPEEQLYRQQWHVLGRRQGDTPPVHVEHEYLTDEELLALQTFPTSWYLYGTRMQRAFQIGNAVPPVLARAVGDAILAAMGVTTGRVSESRVSHEQRHAARL
ncbi:MAG: DNA cytosine methyltransferase [Janthinobacterium lividum]